VSGSTWGSGGGSPAIPFKLYKPAKLLVLVESKSRKAAFLREVARELHLAEVEVEVIRIESIASTYRLAGRADRVTIRAVRLSEALFQTVRSLLRAWWSSCPDWFRKLTNSWCLKAFKWFQWLSLRQSTAWSCYRRFE